MKILPAHREQAKTENDPAIERLRATIEGQFKDMIKFISMMAVGIIIALGGLIAVLQFLG